MYAAAEAAGRRARARNQIVYPRKVGNTARNRTGVHPPSPMVATSPTKAGAVRMIRGTSRAVPISKVHVTRTTGGYRPSDRLPKTAYKAENTADGITAKAPWDAWKRNWLSGWARKIMTPSPANASAM